jgi:pyrroloquinoline quinone (PQQ) biosynthesis protein C
MTSFLAPPPNGDLVAGLQGIVEETVRALIEHPLYGRIYDGTASRELYLRFLTQTYHYVIDTVPLLKQTERVLANSTDPVYQAFHARFAHHSEEEKGHDGWLLDDIAAIGGDIEAAKRARPCLAVHCYHSLIETVLKSDHPLAAAAFGGVLEEISARLGPPMTANLKRHSKIPNIANAVSFIESHGVADAEHTGENSDVLRSITNEGDKAAFLLCARQVALLYSGLLDP